MIKQIAILYLVCSFVIANQDVVSSSNTNSIQPPKGEDMNKKIKGIAKGIVDKWTAEGLTITRDRVEGWISKIDEAQDKSKKDTKTDDAGKVTKEDINQIRQENKFNNLGDNFEEVKNTVVNTFSKIGQVKCENCKKSKNGANIGHDHTNVLPEEIQTNSKNKIEDLENLSVEELIKKQEAIQKFLQMEKMAKLANVAKDFSEIDKFKDIANLANSFKSLKQFPEKEEL